MILGYFFTFEKEFYFSFSEKIRTFAAKFSQFLKKNMASSHEIRHSDVLCSRPKTYYKRPIL